MLARLSLLLVLATPLGAQEGQAWVQLEAVRTLGEAQDSARGYAAGIEGVAGYALDGGWYGVAVGPLPREEAEALRARLVGNGAIPRDSFVVDGEGFGRRFFPVGPEATPVAATPPAADETPEEAAASESLLAPSEKERLQVALQWAGVYEGAIDGAFGRGTRAAMAAWQEASGLPATGVLTTRERTALLAAYDAPLEGLGLRLVRDRATGIEMRLPLGVVALAALEPPFARYDATGALPAQVLLISQAGDEERLMGLYEIMQTLEIVPEAGARERTEDGFVIEGRSATVVSHTEASLEDGEIKGWTLVWPTGDEERRARLLGEMRASFARLPGVLDPAAGEPTEEQAVDLVSGLAVRQPARTATGFFVDDAGTAVTAASAVAGCERVTLDEAHEAAVAAVAGPLAILEPLAPLAPRAVAAFQTRVPRLQDAVAVAGYPYGGVLSQPALTFGTLADLRGLDGEGEVKRLALAALPGDAGGPVLDGGGAVLGMLLPAEEGARVLPEDVAFALDGEAILAALSANGVEGATTDAAGRVTPERLTRDAAGLTVLVSCW